MQVNSIHSNISIAEAIQKTRGEYKDKGIESPKLTIVRSTDKFIPQEFLNVHNYVRNSFGSVRAKNHCDDLDNGMNFYPGDKYELGEYNGVRVTARYTDDRLVSSIDPSPFSKFLDPTNPLAKQIHKSWQQIGGRDVDEIFRTCHALTKLIDVANKNIPIEALTNHEMYRAIQGLKNQGVDTSKPFTINGEKFRLNSQENRLVYAQPKEYVLRPDGKIVIRDYHGGKNNL